MIKRLPHASAAAISNVGQIIEVVTTHANLVLDAHELASHEQLSWFDALIAEAALRSGCAVLFSEDFSHGRKFGELTVCSPFVDDSHADV